MAKPNVTTVIAAENERIQASKNKIKQLKRDEFERVLKLADRLGYFEVSISDQDLEASFKRLIESAEHTATTTAAQRE